MTGDVSSEQLNDQQSDKHLEWLSFHWPEYFSSSSYSLKDDKTENGLIIDNTDNARITHRIVQIHLNPDSNRSLAHLLDVFLFFLAVSRVQTVATAMKATGGVQTIHWRSGMFKMFSTYPRPMATESEKAFFCF